MNPRSCSRSWEIEAARDGRLRGKDLEAARRHRAACAECAQVERELAALGLRVAGLPELTRDALATRRARQRLMANLNAHMLAGPEPASAQRVAWLVAFGAAAAAWFLVSIQRNSSLAVDSQSVIEVRAEPGARWSERSDAQLDQVELADGDAAFTVHPHNGRRVVIRLPDGELDDTGTVFEISVRRQRTAHISVSQGAVLVRLRGRPSFRLGAGETWESESAPIASTALEREGAVETPQRPANRAAPPRQGSPISSKQAALSVAPAALASAEAVAPRSGLAVTTADLEAAKAEDDAYLHIVELLRHAQYGEARARAKRYLLQFPNGFRRVEVLNIATRAGDAGADNR